MEKTRKNTEKKPLVYAALSGGVDSAVSAALLKEQGYNVVGAFIKTWQPPFLECRWPQDREDARAVAAALEIPFTTVDLEDEYKQEVADYMIEEYRRGRTPNPDVMCNKHIKFGAFLAEAKKRGAEYIATGHYVRKSETRNPKLEIPNFGLLEGIDTNKDQSYFLWTLTQEQLAYTLFPVGGYTKPQVRKLAEKFSLPVATKKDSQGVCFLGKLDMKEFLSHYIDAVPGKVLNTAGEVIGSHDGAVFYTLGQRHGFTVTKKSPDDGPHYVVGRDVEENTITVSTSKTKEEADQTTSVFLRSTNLLSKPLNPKQLYQVRFRYRQPTQEAYVEERGGELVVSFTSPQRAVSVGQSLVIYSGSELVAGGIIDKTLSTAPVQTAVFESAHSGV